MKDHSAGLDFSTPYEIAAVRPLRETDLEQREQALKRAHYNTELIPQELVYVDLKTDSGASALGTPQIAMMAEAGALEAPPELAAEAHQGLAAVSDRFRAAFGYPYVVHCAQGRAAERVWARIHVREGSVVPGNLLFPSTRFHIESNGGRVVDVIDERAYEPFSEAAFKGNVDIGKLQVAVEQHGPENVACVYIELCVNACGGHPVSLANLKEVRGFLRPHGISLFLDASRIVENSYLIQQREARYRNHSIAEIVRETCSQADACTLSARKDFLAREGGFIGMRDERIYRKAYFQTFLDGDQPSVAALAGLEFSLRELFRSDRYAAMRVGQVRYLWDRLAERGIPVLRPPGGHGVFIDARAFLPAIPPEGHPAEALAAFIYRVSGIRAAKGPPLARGQTARGIDLLRLAVPAHRYLRDHMDDVADAVGYAFSHRDAIGSLRKVEKAERSRYDPPLFTPGD